MKKIVFFAMGLVSMTVFAQQGNVGINNINPKATLHIDVANINASNDVNQGILIPQLTKQRIADISRNNLLDGTLVYAHSFANITQTDTTIVRRVSQITTKDFYKYNEERDLWERMTSRRLVKPITTNYELSEADYHYYLYANSSSDITVSVPNSLREGFSCIIIQEGSGKVIISAKSESNPIIIKGARGIKTRDIDSAIGLIIKNKDNVKTVTVTGDAIK